MPRLVSTTNPSARLHLPFLDGVRGLAAIWVMTCHLYGHYLEALRNSGPGLVARLDPLSRILTQGKDGVAVFIVLSGFCLMLPVVGTHGVLKRGLGNFFQRRALRILPPYYGAIVLSLVSTYTSHLTKARLGVADTGGDIWRQNFDPGTIATHLLLIHNWFSQWNSTLNTVMWSVAAEWQIYFVFALCLLPLWTAIDRKRGPLQASLIVAICAYLAGLLPVLILPADHDFRWTCPWYVGLFAFGMLGAVIATGNDDRLVRVRDRMPWLTLSIAALAGVYIVRFGLRLNQEYVDLFLASSALCLMLYCARMTAHAVEPARSAILRLLQSRPLMVLGALSYSLYLTHGNIQTRLNSLLLARHLPIQQFSLALWISGIVLPLLFAYAFYLLLEKPFLAARQRVGASAVLVT